MSAVVHFVYRDAKGNVTGRRIEDRTDSEDYIQGLCPDKGDLRTFRLDRILEYVEDEALLPERVQFHRDNNPAPYVSATRPRPVKGAVEICFTGFSAATKASLEDAACVAGMFIRAGVTKQLGMLCCGSNAGTEKVRKARSLGTVVLSELQFRALLATGEIPE